MTMGSMTPGYDRATATPSEYLGLEKMASEERDHRPIPMRDYVLIRKESQKTTAGGLILPENTAEHAYAVVVAVGPGRYEDGVFIETQLKPGDRLMFDGQMVNDIHVFRWRGESYGLVPERAVAAVLPGPLPEAAMIATSPALPAAALIVPS